MLDAAPIATAVVGSAGEVPVTPRVTFWYPLPVVGGWSPEYPEPEREIAPAPVPYAVEVVVKDLSAPYVVPSEFVPTARKW
jgi:hypothetical protein